MEIDNASHGGALMSSTTGGSSADAGEYQLQGTPTNSASSDERGQLPVTSSTNDDHEEDDDLAMSLDEIMHSANSFHAVAKPVTLTMTLAALSVIFINTPQTISQGAAEMSVYNTWSVDSDSASIATQISVSFLNSIVIVSVIGAMTFLIVLLYKYRCMKCLIGYMIFSSSMLLAVLGGTMFTVAIEKYNIPIDKFSFYFIMANFAVVGTIAVFFKLGVPTVVSQGYLVATSVILAWQLSHFDEVTTWVLLVVLAFYDLCAVLTPCGPLKALVNLMQQDDAPEMPGLLYEAELPRNPGLRNGNGPARNAAAPTVGNTTDGEGVTSSAPLASTGGGTVEMAPSPTLPESSHNTPTPVQQTNPRSSDIDMATQRTILLPLAIAKIYRLPVVPAPNPPGEEPLVSTSPLLENQTFTPSELKADVNVILPANGGRIEKRTVQGKARYLVLSRTGEVKRTLLIDSRGRVFEETDDDDDSEDESQFSNSIKLGLGDFIFYSVLVSKAAVYSFTTFAACMLVILAGLGGTLVLLSVWHQALPALPISIFLGVVFYLLTRLMIEPYIEDIMSVPYYV